MNMQKLFIALSFIFVFSYANNDISGFTESILESINNLNKDNNSPAQRPKLASSQPANGYTTPINPYSGKILPIAFKSTIPIITEGADNTNGFDGLPSDCYRTVSIYLVSSSSAYSLINTSSSSYTSSSSSSTKKTLPKHCYDDNPSNRSQKPVVFISSKIGGKASFTVSNLSEDGGWSAYDNYHVEQIQTFKDNNFNTYIKQERLIEKKDYPDGYTYTIGIDDLKKGGLYNIVADNQVYNKSTGKMEPRHNPFAQVKILPYPPKKREFIYLQFDGEGTLENDLYPNKFEKDDVEKKLNNIFKQAVIEYKAQDGNKKIDALSKELIEIDMTSLDPDEANYPHMDRIYKILESFNVIIKGKDGKYKPHSSKDFSAKKLNENPSLLAENPEMHIVMAINKERKLWTPKKCIKGSKDPNDLSNCFGFNPENEDVSTKYYIKMKKKEGDKVCGSIRQDQEKDSTMVTIKSVPKLDEEGNPMIDDRGLPMKSYYAYNDKKKIVFQHCQIIYTNNGYPLIPLPHSIKKGTQATSMPIGKLFNFNEYNDYLPFGSIIMVPRGKGETGSSVLAHELGHSYGLTDVVKDKSAEHNQTEHAEVTDFTEEKIKEITITKDKWTEYKNTYATQERNLMTWQAPIGNKIRYRDTPIACTSGRRDIYIKFNTGEDDRKICNEKGTDCTIKYLTTEDEEIALTGYGENQWECMRDCFRDFGKKANNRIKYWSKKDKDEAKDIIEKKLDINDCDPIILTYKVLVYSDTLKLIYEKDLKRVLPSDSKILKDLYE